MNHSLVCCSLVLAGGAICLQAQEPKEPAPIYRVSVVERSTKAINYRYRAETTPIDFAGTVLLPAAKGTARVSSKQGRTEIEVEFEKLTTPDQFGAEYLTYVLWALTPDGRPHNLGEIIPNGRDRASLRVSTELQSFAMIVTAEPYSAVRQPGDVVVMENRVRPDTTGIIEQVNAHYELLPRGSYTLQRGGRGNGEKDNRPKVSSNEYEWLLQIYEAQNAVAIARSAGAAEFAPDVIAKAETMLKESRQRYEHKGDRTLALQEARQAVQTAEDARLIAVRKQREVDQAKLKGEADRARQVAQQAQAAAAAEVTAAQAQARDHVAQAQAELEAERARRMQAEAEAQRARQEAAATERRDTQREQMDRQRREKNELRARLLRDLNAAIPTRDTPRGLVVTLPDSAFNGEHLRPAMLEKARKLAEAIGTRSDLRIAVEGHSDASDADPEALARAIAVTEALRQAGVRAVARSDGDSRPIGPNGTQNRRVEVVISGQALGDMPLWDRSYSLSSR